MPFDSNGVFSRVMNWTSDQQNGIAIECGRHDAEDNNFAEGFNETFCRDGRAAATGNFNLGNHKIQNLAEGIAATDAVTKGQLDASSAAGVSLNTAQTITGNKTFQVGYNGVILKNTTANSYSDLSYMDNSGNLIGRIRGGVNSSNQKYAVLFSDVDYVTTKRPTDDNTTSIQVDTVGARNTKLGNYVTLGTAQTITEDKIFTGNLVKQSNALDYNGIRVQNTQLSKGTAPSTTAGGQFVFQDKDGYSINDRIGGLEVVYGTNGTIVTRMHACEPVANSTTYASIDVSYPASGSPYTSAPTPTDTTTTSGTQIATTGWVNSANNNVVHKTGNETIAGRKTLTAVPYISMEHPSIHEQKTKLTKGTAPTSSQDTSGGISFVDKDDKILADILFEYTTDKDTLVSLRPHKANASGDSAVSAMSIVYPHSGNPYTTAPASDAADSIVTTINKSKAANGYFQLGNGMIVNWGTAGDINGYNTITFAKAFTSTNYRVVATQLGSSDNLPSMSAVSVTGKTKTTFKVGRRAITEAATVSSIEWIAIGY